MIYQELFADNRENGTGNGKHTASSAVPVVGSPSRIPPIGPKADWPPRPVFRVGAVGPPTHTTYLNYQRSALVRETTHVFTIYSDIAL